MKVDVWSVVLEASPRLVARLAEVLTIDECARADCFATATLRGRYVIARAALRAMLGAYLDRDPGSIELYYASAGKPLLKDGSLDFNLSHSGSLAVYAFARGCEVGIDVEEMRAMPDLLDIARRFFGPSEYAELAALEAPSRTAAFFRCWTRKEAYLKAVGDGILAPLDRFEVTLLPGDPPSLRHIGGNRAAAAQWRVHDLVPAPGYLGALAAKGAVEVARAERSITAQELADALYTRRALTHLRDGAIL